MATLTKQGSVVRVATPYNQEFVNLLKEKVPYAARSWQKPYWMIDAKYLDTVKSLAELYFDFVDVVHDKAQAKQTRETILIEYLGRCKTDDWNIAYANAQVNGSWNVRVSETVLRAYFENASHTEAPTQTTLYHLLGAKLTASQDELKSAFKRAARTWHPDLNKDPDAAEMFRKVKEAFDLLENPVKRAKYDAGLKLQAAHEQVNVPSWKQANLTTHSDYGYRAPATSGIVDCEIENGVKRTITKIHDWKDDTRKIGNIILIRVAYWKRDGDKGHLETKWEQI